MNTLSIKLGSYEMIATQQGDPRAWLIREMIADRQINIFAVSSHGLLPQFTSCLKDEGVIYGEADA